MPTLQGATAIGTHPVHLQPMSLDPKPIFRGHVFDDAGDALRGKLDQITALNKTTSSLIESTSEMLKRQSGEIHEQATSSTIELDKLQNAFNNVYETMDMISNYKVEALENMKQTVNTLTSEVDKAQKYLDKSNQTTVLEVSKELDSKQIADKSGIDI